MGDFALFADHEDADKHPAPPSPAPHLLHHEGSCLGLMS